MNLKIATWGIALAFAASFFAFVPARAAAPLSISYEYGQGLFPAGSSFYLQAGTATYQEWNDSMRVRVTFPVTKKEMDTLYANVRWYGFGGIETTKIKAYDRGGDQITVNANGKITTKSNAGQSAIKGSFSKWRYEKIVTNLKSFVKKKIASEYISYPLDLEVSSNYGVRVAVDDAEIKMHAGKATVSLLPGEHTILVGLYNNTDTIVNAEAYTIEVPDSKLAHIRVGDKNIFVIPE